MTYWNHRVVKESMSNGDDWYTVREVFYNDNDTIHVYMKEAVDISGENIEDLREYCEWILKCFDKPVLNEEDLPV